jgi:GNAT superfamily N-acetyltransferase
MRRLEAHLRARLGNVLDTVRAVGARGAVSEMPRWLLRREFIVLVANLRDVRPPRGNPPAELRLALLTPTDVPSLAQLHPMMSQADVQRRWREGQECIVGWIGATPAYYRWDCAGPAYLRYLHKTFRPPPLTVLTLDVRTHPRFQGEGIGVFAAAFAHRRSLERGHLRRAGLVARWARHVLRYNLAIGATARGTIGYWHAIVRRVYFATGNVQIGDDAIFVASP